MEAELTIAGSYSRNISDELMLWCWGSNLCKLWVQVVTQIELQLVSEKEFNHKNLQLL